MGLFVENECPHCVLVYTDLEGVSDHRGHHRKKPSSTEATEMEGEKPKFLSESTYLWFDLFVNDQWPGVVEICLPREAI